MTVMDDWPRAKPFRYRAERGTEHRLIFARLLRAMHRDSPPMARLFLKRWKASQDQMAELFMGGE